MAVVSQNQGIVIVDNLKLVVVQGRAVRHHIGTKPRLHLLVIRLGVLIVIVDSLMHRKIGERSSYQQQQGKEVDQHLALLLPATKEGSALDQGPKVSIRGALVCQAVCEVVAGHHHHQGKEKDH